ncbi:uncharacterized protein RHO25_007698 [Cercospora beticola]|uniref:Uncharacterized protein n=1 Tax=Cercospora beticola TaxID=122368 RepID=A0ABZ0NU60_CERBT|nr:hypothetical protein RHO25_007698 [Cercospora beticola]
MIRSEDAGALRQPTTATAHLSRPRRFLRPALSAMAGSSTTTMERNTSITDAFSDNGIDAPPSITKTFTSHIAASAARNSC